MEQNKDIFEYIYSAEQQVEIEKIRNKYLPKQEDKLEQLRKLDASVTKKGTIISIMLGIVGILAFGGAMSMILVVGNSLLLPGVLLGVFGIVFMVVAYPIFSKVTEKERERIAPEILALTEELL